MRTKTKPKQTRVVFKIGDEQLRGRSITAANKGFAIAGIPCFADTFVQGGSSVLSDSLVLRNPLLLQAPKSSAQYTIRKLNGND